MAKNFYGHAILNFLSRSSADINLVGYYVCGVVEWDSNSHPHNNVLALRATVVYPMANVLKTHLIIPCSQYRKREEVIVAGRDFK